MRGRVEGYVRSPPLENSSWPAGLKSHPLPHPGEITRAEPAASITLNIAENESSLLPWEERWPHSEKLLRRKFYKTRTHLVLYSQSETQRFNFIERSIPSDPRISDYSSNLFFFFFFQFIVLFLKIFLYKLQNEGSIATSPLRDPSHSPNSKLPPFISSKHFLFFFFFHLNPSCTLQNPSKSLKILRCHATVLVHLSILAIIPLTGSQPGRRKEAACAPWKRRQLVGWQREIGSTRSSQGWRKGLEDGASTTRIPLGGDESQPSCYFPVRNGDRRELGQGKTTLNPRYQLPGAISARPSSRVSPFSSTPSFDNTVIRRLL